MNKDGEHPLTPSTCPAYLVPLPPAFWLFQEFSQTICEFGWLERINILRLRRELMSKYLWIAKQKTC